MRGECRRKGGHGGREERKGGGGERGVREGGSVGGREGQDRQEEQEGEEGGKGGREGDTNAQCQAWLCTEACQWLLAFTLY